MSLELRKGLAFFAREVPKAGGLPLFEFSVERGGTACEVRYRTSKYIAGAYEGADFHLGRGALAFRMASHVLALTSYFPWRMKWPR